MVFILQGGGAHDASQAGVHRALAGDRLEHPVGRWREFWHRVSSGVYGLRNPDPTRTHP